MNTPSSDSEEYKNCAFLLNLIKIYTGETIDINKIGFYSENITNVTGFVYSSPRKIWYSENGTMSRKNKPAKFSFYITKDGSRVLNVSYVLDGEYHKIDGPAVIEHDTDYEYYTPSWYIEGQQFTQERFWKHPAVVLNTLENLLKQK